jgi:hypothetical protein
MVRDVLTPRPSDHYHATCERHFNVERREDSFNQVYDLGFFEFIIVKVSSPGTSSKVPQMKVTGVPDKHMPTSFVEAANDLVQAVRIIQKVVSEIVASLRPTRERCRQRMGGRWSWATAILKMEAVVGLSVAIATSYMLWPLPSPLLPFTTC